jgi:tetratricopeptide (TPR) repeat protein
MKQKKQNIDQSKVSFNVAKSSSFAWQGWLVFIFGALVYLNTLTHQFTQDDAIVIYDNMYTTKGVSGLNGIFTKDTFFGFFKEEGKAKLVSGGRYRPLTPAMFAIEYQLVGKNPLLGHLINILLYGFLCFMIYKLLVSMICSKEDNETNRYFAMAVALLYATHPLHTEAVANIKGRDEIMSMLGSVFALYYMLKYIDLKEAKYMIYACLALFLGLLSKENTITFLAIVPLTLYYFRDIDFKNALAKSAILLLPAILFLMIRSAILGSDFGGTPMELMNNPYLKFVNGSYIPFDMGEKMATIIYTLGKYVQLLIFPHPLTHDYYPRYIDIMSFGDVSVIISLLIYVALIWVTISGFRSKNILSYGAAFYLITLSIVSNIVFPIGTNMSERFMFMPSLGFALVLAYLLQKFVWTKFGKNAFMASIGIIVLLYSVKTISRNFVWESDFKLFQTDVKTSVNSAKVLNAAGGSLTDKAFTEKDENKKKAMLTEALGYLNRAVQVHPTYKNAYLIMGNAYYYMQDYDNAITAYGNALKIDPDYKDAFTNQAIALREAGKNAGEKENNLQKAETYLLKSLQMAPHDTETLRLLGVLNGIKGNHTEAIKYFESVVAQDQKNANAYLNLSTAQRNAGDANSAQISLQKALQLDPTILSKQGN